MTAGLRKPQFFARVLASRTYKRDKDGKFSSGRGGGPGSGRDILREPGLADAVAAASAKYPEATTDERHAPLARAIADEQGFSGNPRVVTRQEMDRLVAEGHGEMFRGIHGDQAVEQAESYRSGEPFYTTNAAYGQGMYFTPERGYAADYAKDNGQILRVALNKDARTITYGEAHAGAKADFERTLADYRPGASVSEMQIAADPGTWALAKGYDAITATSTFGDEVVVLNRTATFVEEA